MRRNWPGPSDFGKLSIGAVTRWSVLSSESYSPGTWGPTPEISDSHYNRYGRPSVVRPESGSKLSFNLSHTGPLALYAASADRVLGIDVERVRHDMDHLALGEHFFAPAERAALRSVPPRSRADAFFNCWTRKEAFVKAHGMGLSLDLSSFEVTLQPGAPAKLISAPGGIEEARRWHFESFVPRRGHIAALVVRGRNWRLRHLTMADLASAS